MKRSLVFQEHHHHHHHQEEEEEETPKIIKRIKPHPQHNQHHTILTTTTTTTTEEEEEEEEGEVIVGDAFVNMDENLLYEVLKHVDARTLGRAACVSKLWHRTAQDERLWELICTRHWANMGCANQQLRSVVLALGGFRRLHSQYLLHLSKPQAGSSSLPWPVISSKPSSSSAAKWGKDEVHLSLSLLSIRYYEKMNFCNRRNS